MTSVFYIKTEVARGKRLPESKGVTFYISRAHADTWLVLWTIYNHVRWKCLQ